MKRVYGRFCSRHNEAVNFYKDLLTKDKRFKAFIKVSNISAPHAVAENSTCVQTENLVNLIAGSFMLILTQRQQKLFTVHQPQASQCVFVCVHEVSEFSLYLMSTLTDTLLSHLEKSYIKSRHYFYYYIDSLESQTDDSSSRDLHDLGLNCK